MHACVQASCPLLNLKRLTYKSFECYADGLPVTTDRFLFNLNKGNCSSLSDWSATNVVVSEEVVVLNLPITVSHLIYKNRNQAQFADMLLKFLKIHLIWRSDAGALWSVWAKHWIKLLPFLFLLKNFFHCHGSDPNAYPLVWCLTLPPTTKPWQPACAQLTMASWCSWLSHLTFAYSRFNCDFRLSLNILRPRMSFTVNYSNS